MIPLKISLKNFLSYGSQLQTIDFTDHALICLTGKNGHGKTSLLDALTWAIWGQARKNSGTSRADEGLVRLGEKQMVVYVEFLFNDRHYRIRREFTKTNGRALLFLDFELFDPEKNQFVTLTDKTIRATQKKIEDLIGLDFWTFVNSSFLRQGQANEFSKKSAKDRKQILANILGLSKYESLSVRANEKARALWHENKVLLALAQKAREELEQVSVKDQRLANVAAEIAAGQELAQKEQDQKIALVEKANVLNLEYERMIQAHQEAEALGVECAKKTQTFAEIVQNWRIDFRLIRKMPSLEKLETHKKELDAHNKMMRDAQEQFLALSQQEVKLEKLYQERKTQLDQKQSQILHEVQVRQQSESLKADHAHMLMAQAEEQKKALCLALVTSEERSQQYKDLVTNKEGFEKTKKLEQAQFEKRRTFYQLLIQRANGIKAEKLSMAQKQNVINDEKNPCCPLCEQLLTQKRKAFLSVQLDKQFARFDYRLARIVRVMKKLKDILVVQHEHIEALAAQDERYQKAELAVREYLSEKIKTTSELKRLDSVIGQQLQIHKAAQEIINAETKNIEELQMSHKKTCASDEQLVGIIQQQKDLVSKKSGLDYNKEVHESILIKIDELEIQIKKVHSVAQLKQQQAVRKDNASRLYREIKTLKKQVLALQQKALVFKDVEIARIALQEQIKPFDENAKQWAAAKDELVREKGKLEAEVERLKNVKIDEENYQKKVLAVGEQQHEFEILSQAFGKNGIQALLIDQALPEIEQEANNILSKLTNNESQVMIESLRDLKSGGVRETLDIKISDVAGMRPYEMFSGGEAFRIDFALRIAISKLLARRAGTALQTLMIDEGFGSQDEDGVSLLIEAIYAIQDDFEKIIVVSHLGQLKESFPVHMIVEKNSSGSMVTIEERG